MKSHLTLAFLFCVAAPTMILGQPVTNGDVNGDGDINIADAVYLLNWQFSGGPGPLPLACEAPGGKDGNGMEVPFARTGIFFEFNSTDLDLGIHLSFDAEGWEEVVVSGPDGRIFRVDNSGSLRAIGSTEVFTESAEPPLDEDDVDAAIAEFLARFPEGEYRFDGRTVGGDRLVGAAVLTHRLPAAPALVFPDPEEEENLADPDATVIEWRDTSAEGDPEIVRYQAVVEFEAEETGEVFTFVVDVAPDPEAATQSITVPREFFDRLAGLEGEFKAEVLAMEAGRNATIVEHDFELE